MNSLYKPTNLNLPNNQKDFPMNSNDPNIHSENSTGNPKDSNINSKDSNINSKDSNINAKESNINAKESNINPLDSIEPQMGLRSYESLDKTLTNMDATIESILDSVKQIDKKHTESNKALQKLIDSYALDILKRKTELFELNQLYNEKSKEPSLLAFNLIHKILRSNFSVRNVVTLFFCVNGLIYLYIQLFGQ